MHVDGSGRLWIRDFAPPWENQTWQIFADDGRWLGSVVTPARASILDIGGDRLLLRTVSELGVETVQSHPVG